MKKAVFIASLAFIFCTAQAQQKNTLLQSDFWKQKPNVEAVKAEIAKGSDPAEQDARSFDATSFAINAEAPLETIKFLLSQKGNGLDKGTHHSRIYLHWAAGRGNIELINYLIANGSEIEKNDSYGNPPIVYAASVGQANPAVYEAFFKAGIDPKKKYTKGANLLLLGIAGDKKLNLSNYLISKGLSLTDTDAEGATAFDYAARNGNVELLKTLLSKGVKPTDNALIYASMGNRAFSAPLTYYKYLVEELKLNPTYANKIGENVLHAIVRKNEQEEIIKYFLEKGADLNKANVDGNTPFMNAAASRNLKTVELLLPKVTNINAVNEKGESALTMAVKNSTPEMVALLLNNGADAKVEDKAGYNLAYYVVQGYRGGTGAGAPRGEGRPQKDEFAEKLSLLQAKGLDLNAPQKDGSTLYHAAIAKENLSLLKKLAALKIDVNVKNKEGLTVLHRAALISKDDEILKYLLSIGADKSIKTDFEETAYELASENRFLADNKVSINFLK